VKITLSQEVTEKLKKLQVKILEANPYAQKSLSATAEAIVNEFIETGTETQVEATAGRLTTNKSKEKSLVKVLQNITAHGDSDAINALEKTLKKLSLVTIKNTKNSLKNGDL